MAYSLSQGKPLPDVNTTTSQTTDAPAEYDTYLSDLAKSGTTAMGLDPTKMVAGFDALQTEGIKDAQTAADSYSTGLKSATDTADTVAKGVGSSEINNFMNPYTSGVVDEMGRLTNQNIQRNIIPGLKGAFVNTGSLGSQRFANATGQTLADLQSTLTGQQTGALQKGYSDAVNYALQNAGLLNTAANTQGNLAKMTQDLGLTGANAKINAGALEQKQKQAVIDAPLKTATNASNLLRGLTIPTSTTQKYTGPMPGAYSASPLQQIVGMASLFAGNASAAKGFEDFVKKYFPGGTGTATGTPAATVTNPGSAVGTPTDDDGNINDGYVKNADGSYTWVGVAPNPPPYVEDGSTVTPPADSPATDDGTDYGT
tara:strand:+ start:923 stop:2035 length:1113 start_codon:yes stop_codon:yes gene_type:complete